LAPVDFDTLKHSTLKTSIVTLGLQGTIKYESVPCCAASLAPQTPLLGCAQDEYCQSNCCKLVIGHALDKIVDEKNWIIGSRMHTVVETGRNEVGKPDMYRKLRTGI